MINTDSGGVVFDIKKTGGTHFLIIVGYLTPVPQSC